MPLLDRQRPLRRRGERRIGRFATLRMASDDLPCTAKWAPVQLYLPCRGERPWIGVWLSPRRVAVRRSRSNVSLVTLDRADVIKVQPPDR
jgi:hypothetical protein